MDFSPSYLFGGVRDMSPTISYSSSSSTKLTFSNFYRSAKLLFSVSSAFGMRADIVNCVKKNVPENLFDTSGASGYEISDRHKIFVIFE